MNIIMMYLIKLISEREECPLGESQSMMETVEIEYERGCLLLGTSLGDTSVRVDESRESITSES